MSTVENKILGNGVFPFDTYLKLKVAIYIEMSRKLRFCDGMFYNQV